MYTVTVQTANMLSVVVALFVMVAWKHGHRT